MLVWTSYTVFLYLPSFILDHKAVTKQGNRMGDDGRPATSHDPTNRSDFYDRARNENGVQGPVTYILPAAAVFHPHSLIRRLHTIGLEQDYIFLQYSLPNWSVWTDKLATGVGLVDYLFLRQMKFHTTVWVSLFLISIVKDDLPCVVANKSTVIQVNNSKETFFNC